VNPCTIDDPRGQITQLSGDRNALHEWMIV
jgi:hypothetical protein